MTEQQAAKLSNVDIALYALYLLGGWQKRVHTEDVALKCYRLVPQRFSWVKYPKHPDLAPARMALEDAAKEKHHRLVRGESERKRSTKSSSGWVLTSPGIKWIEANKLRIEELLGRKKPIGRRLPAERKIRELQTSTAYKAFLASGESANITRPEFAESLVCTVNSGLEILNERLEQLATMAEELKADEVKQYVDFCRRRFRPFLEKGGNLDVEEA